MEDGRRQRLAQAGYEIELYRDGLVTTSGRVESAESVLVPWPGDPLRSRDIAVVRVRVWGRSSGPSPWSRPSTVEAGLLEPSDWAAVPVGPGWEEGDDLDHRRPALVRRSFLVRHQPTKARLYVTAHGVYEAEVNGQRVGHEAMAPGWTVYRSRLKYFTYDVTDMVTTGENAIGAWLGDGWYRGRLGWYGGFYNLFGSDIGLIAQLEIESADGPRSPCPLTRIGELSQAPSSVRAYTTASITMPGPPSTAGPVPAMTTLGGAPSRLGAAMRPRWWPPPARPCAARRRSSPWPS